MKSGANQARPRGLTIVELMVVIAVLGVLVAISAPSMREIIVKQRLKSVNAELVTDLQFARSNAVARNQQIRIEFKKTSAMSCYVVFVFSYVGGCDCTATPGSACSPTVALGGPEEIRTIQVPTETDVQFVTVPSTAFAIMFQQDGMRAGAADFVISTTRGSGGAGQLRTTLNATGRPSTCTPDSSVTGVPTC
jgi:prepilin-type N-terminal cleavage/methylation domain-containing protein